MEPSTVRPHPVLAALCLALLVCFGPMAAEATAQEPTSETPPELLESPPPADSTEPPGEDAPSEVLMTESPVDLLPQEFADWLVEVDPLITAREKLAFLKLKKDYQRHAFIRRFWESRDPFRQTPRNELKDRWEERLHYARTTFGGMSDDRARVYLLHGNPTQAFAVRCTRTRVPAEVWAYSESTQVDFPFLVLFARLRGDGPARVYRPTVNRAALRQTLADARSCLNGERMAQVLAYAESSSGEYEINLVRALAKPKASSDEWVDSFAAYSTDVPSEADSFQAELDVEFPGRRDNRTVVQGVVSIPLDQAGVAEFAGHRSHDFLLNGEIVLRDQLFENFRYRFGFPTDRTDESLPLVFQRYLRPGSYRLVLRVEDMNSGAFYRTEQMLKVPAPSGPEFEEREMDSETAQLFEEATAAIDSGETALRIVPPPGDLHAGFVRIDTLASGNIDKVRFLLDGQRVLTRTRPPYNVEIDLGEFPRRRLLTAEALDDGGDVVARDELELNSGGNRFTVDLISPRPGRTYERSLRAEAEVEIPDGQELERVEFFLDETLVATLYQEPFAQPIPLPGSQEISYVRAVAYTPDGNATEDVVFINAPEYLEQIDVQLVELYATVLDARGRPVQGLSEEDFSVFEEGKPQTITRFERVQDLPIHAGILIDTSGSMHANLGQVRKAALSFLEQTITPKDRAAVITFSKFPRLAVKLTNELSTLGGGLAGLAPEGETALYDSLIFGLYYFTGIRGQRAILLLSDGKDESSRFSFEETLEYARRAGVTIYSIGLDLAGGDARVKLSRLAEETGGRSFFIGDADQLAETYASIEEDLRSQYLVAYQSAAADDSDEFRPVELRVDVPKAKVHTISGYYP